MAAVVRIMAHFVTVLAFGFLFFDDRVRGYRWRPWLWLLLLIERLTVLTLLALDATTLWYWIDSRSLLTPITVVQAGALVLYVRYRLQQRQAVAEVQTWQVDDGTPVQR